MTGGRSVPQWGLQSRCSIRLLPRARDCMELLEKEMSQTAKMKRATAGGKAPENKDYTIHRRFFRCWDKEHEELLHMCRCVKALDPRWKRTDEGGSGAGA